ncbi:MAG: ATP synthase F1 subunit gamma [candidate division KSB1 bacterium]|nr:ATP synthase F1 subunit gamma [candidate division KSB1 bacterium]
MESIQNIKRRLRGVKNISQITKAMELVAATKMRRSQEIALASRPYALTALDLLGNLSRLESEKALPELLTKRQVKKTAVVLVTSDKGLAGAFNANVLRQFEKFLRQEKIKGDDPANSFIAVGQKAAGYLERRAFNLERKFVRVGDYTTLEEVKPIADFLTAGYLSGKWDRVIVFSTHFRTALRQEVLLRQVLPVELENLRRTAQEIIPEHGRFSELVRERRISYFNERPAAEYLFEPSPPEVLAVLAEYLVIMQVYHLILEANASEHAARRIAMKNASDNAAELAGKLTLEYNKSRQAAITKEIVEVVAGAEALS